MIACDAGRCIYERQGLLVFVLSFLMYLIFKSMYLHSHDENKNYFKNEYNEIFSILFHTH